MMWALLVLFAVVRAVQINSGLSWPVQNRPQHLQAHGAGFFYQNETYYMIGENKTTGSRFQSVSCYRSKDLLHWEWTNDILQANESIPDLAPDRIIERPKVIYNEFTQKYVLWMHVDSGDYSYARAGVAWADALCGDYTYLTSYRPLDKYISRDMTAWVDEDGTGYLLGEDRPTGLVIYKLSKDFLAIESEVYNTMSHIESPAIFKSDGVYFLLGSQLTGWAPNDNYYMTASNMSGPWNDLELFVPSGSKTYSSQTTFVLRVNQTLLYCGDRWDPENLAGLQASTYIWLPLDVNTTARTLNLSWYDSWDIDPRSGAWNTNSLLPVTYEAEDSRNTLSNGAEMTGDGYFNTSGGFGVMNIGGPNNGTLTFHNVTISDTLAGSMLKIVYENKENYVQYASVGISYHGKNSRRHEESYAVFLPTFSTRNKTVNTVAPVTGLRIDSGTFDLTIKGLPGYMENATSTIDSILLG